jgi:hypothetical protein
MSQNLKKIYSGLKKWLRAIFGVSFEDKGPTFAIGNQETSHQHNFSAGFNDSQPLTVLETPF